MPWQDAVQATGDGCMRLLDAAPGTRRPASSAGCDVWRGRMGVRVAAPAQQGAASEEFLVASLLGLRGPGRPGAGTAGRRKGVHAPLDRGTVLGRLVAAMEWA